MGSEGQPSDFITRTFSHAQNQGPRCWKLSAPLTLMEKSIPVAFFVHLDSVAVYRCPGLSDTQ